MPDCPECNAPLKRANHRPTESGPGECRWCVEPGWHCPRCEDEWEEEEAALAWDEHLAFEAALAERAEVER